MNFLYQAPEKRGTKNNCSEIKKILFVVPNCLKWRESWSKIIFEFFYPEKKGEQKKYVRNEKNQSCSESPGMARIFENIGLKL